MSNVITLDKFIEDNKDKVFRWWKYRKPGLWTPYEMEQKFEDEDFYEDSICSFAYIRQAIDLGNDYLLVLESSETPGFISYEKLSELTLVSITYDEEDKDEEIEDHGLD